MFDCISNRLSRFKCFLSFLPRLLIFQVNRLNRRNDCRWWILIWTWNVSYLLSLVCWYSRWARTCLLSSTKKIVCLFWSDIGIYISRLALKWPHLVQIEGVIATMDIWIETQLPPMGPQWTWIARARWIRITKLVGRLSSSFLEPKLNRPTKYDAIPIWHNNQPAGTKNKQFNNQPAEKKGKEQIDRRREKQNDNFKILGGWSNGTKSETWSVGHRFGSFITTFPSAVAASWCLAVAQPKV